MFQEDYKNKYTDKQLFLRCLERCGDVPTVGKSMGVSRKEYLTWVVDDEMFAAKVGEITETVKAKQEGRQTKIEDIVW